jgi:hypothetical protein
VPHICGINWSPVNKDKMFWLNLVIWEKFYGVIYGWQADFRNVTRGALREEDNKLNKEIMAKQLIQMSFLLLY